MPSHILSSKLFIPPPHPNLVTRQRLHDRLNLGLSRKLTLISAPGGYGKTTLLSEWIHQCEIPFCWLSLDKQDNDLGRFFTYMIASLETIHIHVDEKISAPLQTQQPDRIEATLIPLINHVAAAQRRFALVLDDYHWIESQDIHKTLTQLLQYLPQHMHLVIGTRTDPPLPLAQMRARGEMGEIRAADLRFTRSEADHFLNQAMGLGLSSSQVTTLTEKTEGWIAGLQLAAISLHGHHDKQAFVRAFAGDDRHIADYLLDEALLRQPAYIQTFLLQTSILDTFCASLCDAVTTQEGSQTILKELERRNLFLVPLDNQRNWYRYHHLFADLLRIRFSQEERESGSQRYQRASEWYEQQGIISEAVRLALLGDDAEKVAQLMEGHLLSIVSTSELSLLDRMLASLPEETHESEPWLALAMAWGKTYLWQFEQAQTLLNRIEASLIRFDELTQNQLRGRVSVLRAYIAGSTANYPESIRTAQNALEQLPERDLTMRSFSLLIIGNAHRYDGKLEDALKFHNDALSLSEQAGDTLLSVMILSRLVEINKITGHLNHASEIGAYALEKVQQYQNQVGSQPIISGYFLLRLSTVYYERNELAMAKQSIEIGMDLAKQWGAYDSLSLGYINIAKIYQAMGNYQQANEFLRDFKEKYPDEDRLQYKNISALEAQIYLRTGDGLRANNWMENAGLSPSDHISLLNFQLYDVLAQVLIMRGQIKGAHTLLARLLGVAEEYGAVEYKIQTRGRLALLLYHQGEENAAIDMLAPAINLAAPEGYLRTFIDQGFPMTHLLYQMALRGIQPEFCNRLLAQFPAPAKPDALLKGDLFEGLSSREIEVLSLIAQGYTNQEIAQELVLSLYTIKSHARNIYSKLGVKNRTEAVAKARLLGLLSTN